jgi:hypothetical protein
VSKVRAIRSGRIPTCRTKMLNSVLGWSPPRRCLAASTSFSSSLTAYSRVVRVSSTSSTIRMRLPTRLDISPREVMSNHWVRVTLVPGASTWPSLPSPRVSYRDRPMAWMGMLGEPGFLRKDRRIRAGT